MDTFNLDSNEIITPIKRGRGRPRKAVVSLEEQEDEVILKYLRGEPMTLEEAALALWMADGRPAGGPMTKMGILKLEQRALLKLRDACEKNGIGPDAFEPLITRKPANQQNNNYKTSEY